MIALTLTAQAQTDTVKVVRNVKQVVVTRGSNGQMQVKLRGTNKDDSYRYTYSTVARKKDEQADTIDPHMPFIEAKARKTIWKRLWFDGAYIGFISTTGDNPLGLKTGRSWEVGISMFGIDYRPWQSSSHLSATVDIIARRYSTGKTNLLLQAGHPLSFVSVGDDVHVKHNHINMLQIAVPLMYHQSIVKNFEIGVGAQLNYNAYTAATTKYTADGDPMKHSTRIGSLNQRPFTVDLLATIGWRNNAHVYLRYSPMSVYSASDGPEMKSIAFGLKFGF